MRGSSANLNLAALALAALSLVGCGTSLDPMGGTGPAASILAFNTPQPPPLPKPKGEIATVDCPHVEVLEGTSAVRVGGGDSNNGVRYQYSLGDVARECTLVGNQISIKVGVQGRVLIGPAGAPGTFSIPMRIVVRAEKDQKVVASKFYRTSATIPAGDTQADFTVISEPLLVPLLREQADEDYTVLVGFDQSGGKDTSAPRKRRR